MGEFVRVVIPDSHGAHIDWPAAQAVIADIRRLCPKEVVLLGDHLDCGGTFTDHQRSYTNEMTESYEDDVSATNLFFDKIQRAAPDAAYHYLEGNHEQRVERWASRIFESHKDAEGFIERNGPGAVLKLKEREIRYYRRALMYQGIPIQGTIKLGKCFFTHGISASQYATAVHLRRFCANVVHGHTHRCQSVVERSVTSAGYGAWCPGTLAKLQPLYQHTNPTSWTHGYAVQFIQKNGSFLHINVPIAHGKSLLGGLLK